MKRFILWDYPRGSRPYDVIVALILAFIFLTPRAWFRDFPKASSVAMVLSDAFFVSADELAKVPDNQRIAKATEIVQKRLNRRSVTVKRVEPVPDSEDELLGYMVFCSPAK